MNRSSSAGSTPVFHSNIVAFANSHVIASPTGYLLATSLPNRLTYVLKRNPTTKKWELLYTWSCSIGKPTTPTPTGMFQVIGRRPNFGSDTYQVRYATRFSEGYYYHSTLYDGYGKSIINPTLGKPISNGCIRLAPENAKWIYENITDGTPVIIY